MINDDKNYIVYKHTNKINGKLYIGITSVDVKSRWKNGNGYNRQSYFYNAIQKYGWENFDHEILFDNLSKNDACIKEAEMIAYYKSNEKEFGYNIASGGFSGNRGLQRTDEQKNVFREAQRKSRNKSFSENRICQFDLDGRLIKIYDFLSVASEETGILGPTIRYACQKGYGHSKGFIWSYYSVAKNYIKIISKLTEEDQVLQFDIYGNLIKTYLCDKSIKIVSPEFPSTGHIRKCLNKKVDNMYGYVWRYKKDI